MASSAKHLSLLFLLTLLFSLQTNARESQFFNKMPNNNVVKQEEIMPTKEQALNKQEQDPSFIPDNENAYGLYGQESEQLPPTSTTNNNLPYKVESGEPLNKFLPDNYNPVSYVTKPQGYTTTTTTNNRNTNNNLPYKAESGEPLNKFLPDNYNPVSYVTKPQGYTTTNNRNTNYYGNGNNVQKEGMSDTRFLANGKYYYNIHREKYYPNGYENSMGVGSRNEYNNNKGYYGNNNENSYENNNNFIGGYQTQGEYPDPDSESQDEFIP